MSDIRIRWADNNLKRFGKQVDELHLRFPKVLPRIINQVGDRAKTQVIRNLTKQTGLPRATIVKAVGDPARAHPGSLTYGMTTRGGNIRLKFLSPRETRAGVVAKPWGKATLFPRSFMKGGKFPNRVVAPKLGGHVWINNGRGVRIFAEPNQWGGRSMTGRDTGQRITQVRSGMTIPTEMTTGATKAAFEAIAGPLLQQRVEAALRKLLGN